MPSFVHKILSDKIEQANAALPLSETLEEIRKLQASHAASLAQGNLLRSPDGKQSMPSSNAKNEDAAAPLISSAVSESTSLEELVQIFSDPQVETQALHDEQGQPVGTVTRQSLLEAMLKEVKQAKQPQSDSSELLAKDMAEDYWTSQIYKEAPIGLGFVDTQLRYLDINNWLAEMNGLSVEEHLGHSISELFPEWAPSVEPKLRQVIETGEPILEETGSLGTLLQRCFHYSYMPVKSDDGTVIGVSCAVMEITEQKKAEHTLNCAYDELESLVQQRTAELQATNQKLQTEIADHKQADEELTAKNNLLTSVLESTTDAIFLKDIEGRYLVVNQATSRVFGVSSDEAIGKDDTQLFPADEAREIQDIDSRVISSGNPITIEEEIISNDCNSSRIFLTTKAPYRNHEGQILGVIGIARDITERKQIEEELTANNNLLTSVLEGTTDPVFVKDLQSRYLIVNPAAAKVFGMPAEEIIGKNDHQLFPAEVAEAMVDFDQRVIESGMSSKVEEELLSSEFENPRTFLTTKDVYLDHEGAIAGIVGIAHDITERKQAEQATREKQLQLDDLLSNVNAIILEGDPFTFNYVGGQVEKILGYPKEMWDEHPDGPGGFWFELLHPDDLDKPKYCRQSIERGEDHSFEYRLIAKDGKTVWFYDTVMVETCDGNPVKTRSVMVDITERKFAEQALQDRTARYELIAAGAADAVWDWDIVNESVYYSPRWKELYGFAQDEIGDSIEEWSSRVHPDDLSRVMEAIQAHFDGKTEFFEEEYRICCKDGTYKWVHDRGIALRDDAENAIRMAGSESDITERIQAEKALQKSEERLELAIRGTSDGFWDCNLALDDEYWSPRYKELLGYKEDEITASHEQFLAMLHPDDAPLVLEAARAHFEEGQPFDIEIRLLNKKQEYQWFQSRAQVSRDENGKPVRMVGSIRDITERKKFEHALQRLVDTSSRKFGESLFESIALELADVLQADYTFIGKFPEAGKEYVRTIAAVANGKRVPNFEYYIADTPNEECVGMNVCSIRSNVTNQYPSDVLLQEIGVEGYVGISLRGASGELMGIMAALYRSPIDNTEFVESILQVFSARVGSEIERQQAELQSGELRDELSHMGRVATMGELGTGLAHELNQPLAAIANYCFVGQTVLAKPELIESDKLKEVFAKMEQQTLRAGAIIKRLREHVQKVPSVHAAVPIGDVVQDVIELMNSELKFQEIQLELNIDEPKQEVLIDSIQIQQVLMNLIKNALDAIDEIENDDRRLIITKSPPIDGMIEIAVCDSGMGIPEDKLESVFEAFFTTKRTGMGMGLAICRSIIETHNGRLWATSNPDCGTTFHFTLPISKDKS
ncbi:MAG: hypothetical protein COA78_05005 [Blastopirellula sp.]|nr:MAG: hypothetical protein COA78_05005 [Blastopirellula sp.]